MSNEQDNISDLIFEANRWRLEAKKKGHELHFVWFLMIIGSLVVTGLNQYNKKTVELDDSARIGICEKETPRGDLFSGDDKQRLFAQATATAIARYRIGRGHCN